MASNVCGVKTTNKLLKALSEVTDNVTTRDKIFALLYENGKFDEGLIKFLQDRLGKDVNLNITDSKFTIAEARKLAKPILEYFYTLHPDADYTSRETMLDKSNIYGYTADIERSNGLRHVGDIMLQIHNEIIDKGIKLKDNKLNTYVKLLKEKWLNYILLEASSLTNKSVDELLAGFNEANDKAAYLDKVLGGTAKSKQATNKLAVWKELFCADIEESGLIDPESYYSPSFINEVLSLNKSLQTIKRNLDSELDKLIDAVVADDQASEDNGQGSDTEGQTIQQSDDNEIVDIIGMYNNHSGQTSSYLKSFSERIQNYLNALKKLTEPKVGSEDTSNSFGIPDCMNFEQCVKAIRQKVRFDSFEQMVEDIERVAKTVKGFEAFAQLAYDLKHDADFANAFMHDFRKALYSKDEVVVENGKSKVRQANKNTDAVIIIRDQLFDDIESTILSYDSFSFATDKGICINRLRSITGLYRDYLIATGQVERTKSEKKRVINNPLDRVNENGKKLFENEEEFKRFVKDQLYIAIADTARFMKSYLPSITEDMIYAYVVNSPIESNEVVVDDITNSFFKLNNLLGWMEVIGKEAIHCKTEYDNIISNIQGATARNQQRDALRELGTEVDLKEYEDIDSLKDTSFLTGSINDTIKQIAEALVDFTVPDTDNNTRNIYGNNQSDWINHSHFSFMKRLSEGFVTINGQLRNPLLERWGIRKLTKNQYKYSTFLLEQYDEEGNRLNVGLFRKVGDQFVLTEYAQTLLKIGIFQGSSDLDNNTNAGYSKMTKGDYLPTLYLAYHADGYTTADTRIDGVELGTFFPRTPSDAPKTYDIRMPKYDTKGLFDYSDENGAAAEVYDATMRYINVATAEELGVAGLIPTSKLVSKSIQDYIFPTGDLIIGPKGNAHVNVINGDANIVRVAYNDENGNVFVLEGVAKLVDDSLWLLTEPKYIGMVNKNIKNGRTFNAVSPKTANFPGGIAEHNDIFDIFRDFVGDMLEQGDQDINGKQYEQVKKTINKKHPVYLMLLNTFKQELLDAATALNHYFEFVRTEGGTIEINIDENGVPVLKNNPAIRNQDGSLRGYNFYHLKGGKLFVERGTKDGHKLRGVKLVGNVFHSDRFNIFTTEVDEDGKEVAKPRSFLDEIISEEISDTDKGMINLLYGNESGTNLQIIFNMNPEDAKDPNELKVVDIKLTEAQEAKVAEQIEGFLKEYLKQAVNEINKFEQFIEEDNLKTYDKMEEFAINYLLFYNASSDIFEGDSKFYKDTRTIFKRAKQDQAAGKAYASADFSDLAGTIRGRVVDNENYSTALHPIANSFITSGMMQRPKMKQKVKEDGTPYMKDGKPVMEQETKDGVLQYEDRSVQSLLKEWGLDIAPRNGFRAVTIANSKNSRNATFDRLVEDLTNMYKRELNIPEEAARAKAATLIYGPVQFNKDGTIKKDKNGEPVRIGGFTDTKVNDAQSYITFEEFIRRLDGKGMLKKYMPLIEKIMDESQPLTAKDLEAFVQVQKNYYYDFIEDEDYGIFPPRQIKNAEFVLIPRFIKGTQLEKVYDIMKRGNIDQLNTVETSKAANETVLNLWDNEGDIDWLGKDGMIDDAKLQQFADNFNANAQNYYYNHLYSQQETPQHMDAENKAGIQIIKKLIDNIPPNHPRLAKVKEEYFRLLCSNIDESLSDLLEELDIPVNENGKIDLDENGNIKGINMKVLFDKFRDEALRTGMDTNMLKYVTLDTETNMPYMPAYMNNILTKFESIFQSVLNHSITRQTLKGFHAAQVTNVGFKSIRDIFNDENFDAKNVTYDKKLRYHPEIEVMEDGKKVKKTAGYIEIMVPLSFLGIDRNSPYYKRMTMEQILTELESKGLLDIIGYRIPTEGKQSVCNMKVVGFLDDAQGSTIVVPDEWVAQTGSDFDIDSIYAIQYNLYKKGNGEAVRIDYKESFDEFDYLNYLRRYAEKELDASIKNDKTKAKSKLKELLNADYDKFLKENKDAWIELLKILDETGILDKKRKGSDIFKSIRGKAIKETKEIDGTPREKQLAFSQRFITELTERLYKVPAKKEGAEKVKAAIQRVITAHMNTVDYISNAPTVDYKSEYREQLKQTIADNIETYNKIAKEAGLLTFEEFTSDENKERLNSKQARDNKLLSLMQTILNDPSALEENLSRSNFDDIIAVRNAVMNIIEKARRDNTTPNNVFDQIQYQEDAMSGADLKALSVTLDTFCSVCNTARPTLTKSIRVVYEESETVNNETIERNYDRKAKKHTYGLEFEHKEYGWSKTNRNLADKILTAYSSQTTALILDAVKEGNIPNVNTYSFGAFKTLVNSGVSYEAAIPFIMQPAITRVIQDYNKSNSVFGVSFGNPVVNAIREIAKELNIEVTDKEGYNLPIEELMKRISDQYKDEIGEIFERDKKVNSETGQKEHKGVDFTSNFPIIVKLINDRLQNRGMFEGKNAETKKLLFDLCNILIFNRLQMIAKDISDIARCCNPDKFGAKQSIYATRDVLNSIDEILYKKDVITPGYKQKEGSFISRDRRYSKYPKKPILIAEDYKGDQVNIIEAIYPGCNVIDGNFEDIITNMNRVPNTEFSKYPTLYAFLRNATCTSLILSKHVFDTERPRFVDFCNGIRSVFSGNNPRVSEQVYRDFQRYILGSMYSDVPTIKSSVIIRVVDGRTKYSFGKLTPDEERRRIYGYGYPPGLFTTIHTYDENGQIISSQNVQFAPKDINNPTDEEMEIFDRFSPAQKVAWIKANFEEPRLFSYINVSLINTSAAGTRANTQSLSFSEDNVDINHIYSLFRRAYRNTNPILVSAALDVIKYAAQVEGFKMSKNAVMKVIDADVLLQEDGNDGIRFVHHVQNRVNDLNNGGSYRFLELVENLYENYLRSHPKTKEIKTTRLTLRNISAYHLNRRIYGGMIMLNSSDTNYVKNLEKLGIIYEHSITGGYGVNKYIRLIDTDGTNTLYKIEPFLFNPKGVPTQVVLYPLTNLRENENSVWSIDARNNRRIMHRDLYRTIVEELKQNFVSNMNKEWVKQRIDAFETTGEFRTAWYKDAKALSDVIPTDPFDINELSDKVGGRWTLIKNKILNHFSNGTTKTLFIRDKILSDYIHSTGDVFASHQTIIDRNGNTIRVTIGKFAANGETSRDWWSSIDYIYLATKDGEGDPKQRENPSTIPNSSLREIVKDAQNGNQTHIDQLYYVNIEFADDSTTEKDDDDGANARTMLDCHSDTIGYASRASRNNADFASFKYRQALYQANVTRDLTTIDQQKTLVDRETAKYAHAAAAQIIHNFNVFRTDPADASRAIRMQDDEAMTCVFSDVNAERDFLNNVMEAEAYIRNFEMYESIKLENPTEAEKVALESIQADVLAIKALPIQQCRDTYVHRKAEDISTNPLIRENFIDVMDGFWMTYGDMWRFNDIAENGNPFLQIMLKDVLGNIDAQRVATLRYVKEFRKRITQFKEEAERRGLRFDVSKFVDKHGRWVQDYDGSFADKVEELKANIDAAIQNDGLGSIAHIRAKLEFDKFKAIHCHQQAHPEYYITKCLLLEEFINTNPRLAEAYYKLYYERCQLYDYITEEGIEEDKLNAINQKSAQIRALRDGETYIDPRTNEWTNKGHAVNLRTHHEYEEGNPFPIGVTYDFSACSDEEAIYSVEAAGIIDDYLTKVNELEREYFSFDPTFGFEDTLNRNLQIISSFERRGADGELLTPLSVLMQNETYANAKHWIATNARYVLVRNPEEHTIEHFNSLDIKTIQEAASMKPRFFSSLINKAKAVLGLSGYSTPTPVINYIRRIAAERPILDKYGRVDGRLLTDEERRTIKLMLDNYYHNDLIPIESDRILLSNAQPTNEIFTKTFYDKLAGTSTLNVERIHIIDELNRELRPYYNEATKTIDFGRIPDTPEGIATLNRIGELYQKLRLNRNRTQRNQQTQQWIEENVEYVTNAALVNRTINSGMNKSREWQQALLDNVLYEKDEDGEFVEDSNGEWMFNKFLFSYARPKEEVRDRFTSDEKRVALEIVNNAFTTTILPAYDAAKHEAEENGTYEEWWEANHVYNPYTKRFEPIACWVKREFNTTYLSNYVAENYPDYDLEAEDNVIGKWIPNISQTEKNVIPGKENPEYNPNVGLVENYVPGSDNGRYDSHTDLNEVEKEARDYMYNVLLESAQNRQGQGYFKRGNLPKELKKEEMSAALGIKELLKLFGIGVSTETGNKPWYREINYDMDRVPVMPMTSELENKQTRELERKIEEKIKNAPKEEQCSTAEEFARRTQEYEEDLANLKQQLKELKESLMNRDWIKVIENYLIQAGRFNAVQENKQKLYFLQQELQRMRMYTRTHGMTGDLKVISDTDNETVYDMATDDNLVKQLEVTMRRILLDQWKEPEGNLTKFASALQSFTSANYMTFNIRGGIANVTLGLTGILGERLASEYFQHWNSAVNEWRKGAISYARRAYNEAVHGSNVSYTKQDAIIKYFNVVDYDEHTGLIRERDLKSISEGIRNFTYSPQTMGEHFMQNSVLFAMLKSHKLVETEHGVTYMNRAEYLRYKEGEILDSILDDEQKEAFREFKNEQKADKNKAKDYAWFRKNLLVEWAYIHSGIPQIKEFIKKRKEAESTLIREFDELPDMYSQLKLGEDGDMAFVEGSQLEALHNQLYRNSKVSEAEQLLGNFAERVRKVNNKIHGVYNRDGAAYIEKNWWGSLVMQYHKHLPIGLLKRYRARGLYNEFRGSVEKGLWQSMADFCSLNWRKIKAADPNITDEQLGAIQGLQYFFLHSLNYFGQFATTWHILPEYERANILRNFGDFVGVIGGFMTLVALWYIADTDDEWLDNPGWNLAVYEMDRLASECFLYNPWGGMAETKKLMSTPVSAQSVVADAYASVIAGFKWLTGDEDYDMTYQSGRFAGQNKLWVYIKRRIPMWSSLQSLADIVDSNHYFKLGDTGSTFLGSPKGYASDLRGHDVGRKEESKKKRARKRNKKAKKAKED